MYRVIERQSVLVDLDTETAEEELLQDASKLLQEHGFVVLRSREFPTQAERTEAIVGLAEQLVELYSKGSTERLKRSNSTTVTTNDDSTEPSLSALLQLESVQDAFPMVPSMGSLDLPPLVHEKAAWKLRTNRRLFAVTRQLTERSMPANDWTGKPVRVEALPPVSTYHRPKTAQLTRAWWEHEEDSTAPLHGLLATTDMSVPSRGGLMLAPGFQHRAGELRDAVSTAGSPAARYYNSYDHVHSLPAQTRRREKLPVALTKFVTGKDRPASSPGLSTPPAW